MRRRDIAHHACMHLTRGCLLSSSTRIGFDKNTPSLKQRLEAPRLEGAVARPAARRTMLAKLMKMSARGCARAASATEPCTGIATSSRPKNTFWNPPALPGCTTQATDGVGRPARRVYRVKCNNIRIVIVGEPLTGAARTARLHGPGCRQRGAPCMQWQDRWTEECLLEPRRAARRHHTGHPRCEAPWARQRPS